MNKKNGRKIISISLMSIIIIIALILALLAIVLCTDIFKSDKELFFKYAMQLVDKDNNLNKYIEKKSQEPYKNNGNITCNVSLPEENLEEQVKQANNINITFDGNINNTQQRRQYEISLNYSNDVNFPISFRQDGAYYGIQTEYIGSKYIAIENNNLKELCKKLGMSDINAEEIPDKIDFKNLNTIRFTDEEKENLKEKYKEILETQLSNGKFSKAENSESKIYVLELAPDDIKSVIKNLLSIFKTDEIILSKINSISEEEITAEHFENLIEEIDKLEIEENIKIQVYVQNKKLNKIVIKSGDKDVIALEKRQDDDSTQYNLTLTILENETESSIYFKARFKGINNVEYVQESYTIAIENVIDEETTSYEYNIENKVSFNVDTPIENIDEENAIILNNQSDEVVANLMEAIGNRMTEVNKMHTEELGVITNPLTYTNPFTMLLNSSLNISPNNQMQEAITQESQTLNSPIQNTESTTSLTSDTEKDTFNAKFTKYEGQIRGSIVQSLNQEVTSSNAVPENRLVQLTADMDNIETTKMYNVTINYDSDGYVNEIVVEPVK